MDAKPDGKKYARITRRSVALIEHIRTGRLFQIDDIANEIYDKKTAEFYLKRFNRQMSVSRTKDYIRFLREMGVIVEQGDKYILDFARRRLDGEWAQALSDLAFLHIAKMLNKPPENVPSLIENALSKFYKNKQLPTLNGISDTFKIDGGRNEEIFRWSMYLYTDGETCPFTIRHFPVLAKRSV